MNKLALNFICKNESKVIERMLNSVKNIVDLIVVNDTGSTDGTQDIIKKFGIDNDIPTFVFERTFDDFQNSRNFAMQKLNDVVNDIGWDKDKTHGFWIDCDEQLVIDHNFNKTQFTKDLYMINTYIGSMKYTRNTFFKLSKSFEWYGVVHEFIISKESGLTSGLAENISVKVSMDGHSWDGNISDKYFNHSQILEKYLSKDKRDPRWIFYCAQSFHDSASSQDRLENEERLRRSMKYYKERVNRTDGYEEERFYSQFRLGTIKRALEYPWAETMQELLKAYAMDPMRAEPIKVIIDYYLSVNEWNLAYLYSKAAKVTFHGKNPYPTRLLFVDESLYTWKLLEVHAAACYYTGRKEEAAATYKELQDIIKKMPQIFSQDDMNKINANAQFFR